MEKDSPGSVTRLLQQWQSGDSEALDRLIPLVQTEIQRLARKSMLSERKDHTLQPTALVNEAYLRLVDMQVDWRDRSHFLALTARLMRRILVDHARARRTAKRGDPALRVTLDENLETSRESGTDLVELDDALEQLASEHPRVAQIVELKYFGGLKAKEIAEVLEVTPKRVYKEIAFAKAWLYRALSKE